MSECEVFAKSDGTSELSWYLVLSLFPLLLPLLEDIIDHHFTKFYHRRSLPRTFSRARFIRVLAGIWHQSLLPRSSRLLLRSLRASSRYAPSSLTFGALFALSVIAASHLFAPYTMLLSAALFFSIGVSLAKLWGTTA